MMRGSFDLDELEKVEVKYEDFPWVVRDSFRNEKKLSQMMSVRRREEEGEKARGRWEEEAKRFRS
jgi:hypothetical protein